MLATKANVMKHSRRTNETYEVWCRKGSGKHGKIKELRDMEYGSVTGAVADLSVTKGVSLMKVSLQSCPLSYHNAPIDEHKDDKCQQHR